MFLFIEYIRCMYCRNIYPLQPEPARKVRILTQLVRLPIPSCGGPKILEWLQAPSQLTVQNQSPMSSKKLQGSETLSQRLRFGKYPYTVETLFVFRFMRRFGAFQKLTKLFLCLFEPHAGASVCFEVLSIQVPFSNLLSTAAHPLNPRSELTGHGFETSPLHRPHFSKVFLVAFCLPWELDIRVCESAKVNPNESKWLTLTFDLEHPVIRSM